MRIKNHHTGNQYLFTESNIWVRNFLKPVMPLDINKLSTKTDFSLYFENEIANERQNNSVFDFTSLRFNSAVIVSDGYNFKEKSKILSNLPKTVAIITTNRSLVKWNINRKIDFFLINNPYSECLNYMPAHGYYPRCISSTRTSPQFIETYKRRGGMTFSYLPTPEQRYASPSRTTILDDYRNPICAAIHLAQKIGVKKLLLFCCDDSFDTERPAAIRLENNLWTYPQHLIPHSVIDGMCHWYKTIKGVEIGDYSSGPFYKNISYIAEEEVCQFFKD